MKTDLSFAHPAEIATECLAVVVTDIDNGAADRPKNAKPEVAIQTNDAAVRAAAASVLTSGDVTAKTFEITVIHEPEKLKAKRLLLIGAGKAKSFQASDLCKLAGAVVRALKPRGIRSVTFVTPDSVDAESAVKNIIEGAFVGNFDPDTYKSDRKDQQIDSFTVVASSSHDQKKLQQAHDEAVIIGESQNFTRDLVNEPSNHMTPTILAERAKKMAKEVGLKCETYGAEKIKELKMGAFWGVAQGSDEPPALIVLQYEPAGAPANIKLGLVGKGITFDTGGISIKPADGMEKMKYDMAGGAAMLGAMRAIALLKPNVKVTCIVCATENMPSGKAQKPGDIQTAMSGKTIEIINTDAEGRLVLADGLTYAKQLGCTHLIDAATLTGAVVVALGYANAGVFANDDKMYERFNAALNKSGEKFWRLPLGEEYLDNMRSNIADLVNAGARGGGASNAAAFLKEFAEDTPWLHLDIAGTAWMEDQKPWIAKGPSGIAVRTLVEFARDFKG
jgi:leucyl aminopeptidase